MPHLSGLARPAMHLAAPDPRTTLDWMVRLTQDGQKDVELRLFTEKLCRHIFPHDYLSEYAAILNWVRTHIRYSRDPVTIEQVKTPRAIVETETGDCDDMTVLIGTLVGIMGGKARYVAGAFVRGADGRPTFSHVWCEAWEPNAKAWVVLDPVPGRRVHEMLNRMIDSIAALAVA